MVMPHLCSRNVLLTWFMESRERRKKLLTAWQSDAGVRSASLGGRFNSHIGLSASYLPAATLPRLSFGPCPGFAIEAIRSNEFITSKAGPGSLARNVLRQHLTVPFQSRYRRVYPVLFAALMIIVVAQMICIYWLHRRVSDAETGILDLAANFRSIGSSAGKGLAPSPTIAPRPAGISTDSTQSNDQPTTANDPELGVRANPLTPHSRARRRSQATRPRVSRSRTQ